VLGVPVPNKYAAATTGDGSTQAYIQAFNEKHRWVSTAAAKQHREQAEKEKEHQQQGLEMGELQDDEGKAGQRDVDAMMADHVVEVEEEKE
jgi:hypothetical protein